jgi:membrane protein
MTHERPPLWSIGLLALLLAAGLRRQWHSGTKQKSQTGATRLDNGHGRSATTPSEIPVRGWKDILLRIYEGISEDRILANAAAVTFYTLLALFPGIAALVSIYGLFADPSSMANQLDAASGILPSEAVELIRNQLTRLTSQGNTTLGISFVVGLVISLWSANGGIKALFDALNAVYEEKEKRSFVRLNAISMAFTLGMIAFLLIALVGVVALPVALNYLPNFIGSVLNIARWPVLLVLAGLPKRVLMGFASISAPSWPASPTVLITRAGSSRRVARTPYSTPSS